MTPDKIAEFLKTSFIETSNLALFRSSKNVLTNKGMFKDANTGFLDGLNSVIDISNTAEYKCNIVVGNIMANSITDKDINLLLSLYKASCPIYNNFVTSCKVGAIDPTNQLSPSERVSVESMIKHGRDYLEGLLELEVIANELSSYKNTAPNFTINNKTENNYTDCFNKDYSHATFNGPSVVDSTNYGTITQTNIHNYGINGEQLATIIDNVRKSAKEEIQNDEQQKYIIEKTDKLQKELESEAPNKSIIKDLTSDLDKITNFVTGATAFGSAVAALISFIGNLF